MYNTKLSNPKDEIGSDKLPTHLVPSTIQSYAALAFLEGALKYGSHNWRAAGVRASIYKSALDRHVSKWWNGEDVDPKTGVPHLASALACIGIILDARELGKFTDDRPPSSPELVRMIDGADVHVKHLKAMFEKHTPRHWSIADDPEIRGPYQMKAEEIVAFADEQGDRCGAVSNDGAQVCMLVAGHPHLHVTADKIEEARKLAFERVRAAEAVADAAHIAETFAPLDTPPTAPPLASPPPHTCAMGSKEPCARCDFDARHGFDPAD